MSSRVGGWRESRDDWKHLGRPDPSEPVRRPAQIDPALQLLTSYAAVALPSARTPDEPVSISSAPPPANSGVVGISPQSAPTPRSLTSDAPVALLTSGRRIRIPDEPDFIASPPPANSGVVGILRGLVSFIYEMGRQLYLMLQRRIRPERGPTPAREIRRPVQIAREPRDLSPKIQVLRFLARFSVGMGDQRQAFYQEFRKLPQEAQRIAMDAVGRANPNTIRNLLDPNDLKYAERGIRSFVTRDEAIIYIIQNDLENSAVREALEQFSRRRDVNTTR